MSKNAELISVIIPIYNVETYLRKCLDSVTDQTYKHLEIILVNDGSTDSSGQICFEYAAKDGRIKLLAQRNQGAAAARNKGIEAASGHYIIFVDSDDWLDESMIEKMYSLISEYNAEIAVCNYYKVNSRGIILERAFFFFF